LRIGAANEAVAFYRQAQGLSPAAAHQLGLGQALLLQPGKIDEARQLMEAALTIHEAAGDGQGAIKAGLHLAASYLGTQEGAQVLYWARRVLPDLEAVDDPLLHASAHYLMGTAQFRNGYSLSESEEHFSTAMKLVEDAGLDSEIALMSCFEWGNLSLERGDYTTAVVKFQQAQQLAKARQSIYFEGLSLNNLAYALLNDNKLTEAQQTIDEAFAITDTYALRSIHFYLLSTNGEIALAVGALDRAEAAFHQAIDGAQRYDNTMFVANVWAHLGRVLSARGALIEASAQLERANRAIEEEHVPYLQAQIDLWLTAVKIDQEDYSEATRYLRKAFKRLTNTDYQILQQSASQLQEKLRQNASTSRRQ